MKRGASWDTIRSSSARRVFNSKRFSNTRLRDQRAQSKTFRRPMLQPCFHNLMQAHLSANHSARTIFVIF